MATTFIEFIFCVRAYARIPINDKALFGKKFNQVRIPSLDQRCVIMMPIDLRLDEDVRTRRNLLMGYLSAWHPIIK